MFINLNLILQIKDNLNFHLVINIPKKLKKHLQDQDYVLQKNMKDLN